MDVSYFRSIHFAIILGPEKYTYIIVKKRCTFQPGFTSIIIKVIFSLVDVIKVRKQEQVLINFHQHTFDDKCSEIKIAIKFRTQVLVFLHVYSVK